MVAPFNQAWMLLKQRGHELNLPPPRTGNKPTGYSPQDLTDSRVNEATIGRGALDEFGYLNSISANKPTSFSNSREAKNELGRRQEITNDMERQMSHAKAAEINERIAEQMQRKLDQQTLARMGQQPEADEMDAMGVPPMSRSIGGTPPANLGRAGSTGEIPRSRQRNAEQMRMYGMDDIDDAGMDLDFNDDASPAQRQQLIDRINQNIEPTNPFPKPIGQNVRGDLMDWAAGAGREAGKPDIVDRTYDEGGSGFDLNEMHDDDMYDEIHNEPLDENNPAKHSIASTTLRASPRQQKRGQMDSGRNEFRRPGDASSKQMTPSQRMLQQMMQMDAQKEAGF
jgi:hypothetical protein